MNGFCVRYVCPCPIPLHRLEDEHDKVHRVDIANWRKGLLSECVCVCVDETNSMPFTCLWLALSTTYERWQVPDRSVNRSARLGKSRKQYLIDPGDSSLFCLLFWKGQRETKMEKNPVHCDTHSHWHGNGKNPKYPSTYIGSHLYAIWRSPWSFFEWIARTEIRDYISAEWEERYSCEQEGAFCRSCHRRVR